MNGKRILAALLSALLVAALGLPASASSAVINSLALGGSHGAAIKSDGTAYTWGTSDDGQIGDAVTTSRLLPVEIIKNAVSVAAGDTRQYKSSVYQGKLGGHTLALLSDGSLWAWGENAQGQLGDGTRTRRNDPVMVMENVAYCAAGNGFSFAVKTDGSLWAWGSNDFGQLGDGSRTEQLWPVKVMESIAFVEAGAEHTLAVDKSGTLWAWGSNSNGQLGDDSCTSSNEPIKVMENVVNVGAGGDCSAAVLKNGELWTWGSNVYGQLGDGTRIERINPVKIMDGVKSITVGGAIDVYYEPVIDPQTGLQARDPNTGALLYNPLPIKVGHMVALKKDGTAWSWGYNTYGQLGDGTRTARNYPAQILSGVNAVDASGQMGAAVMNDGTLYIWGLNSYGQLGDGTRTDRISPVKIMTGVVLTSDTKTVTALATKQSVLVNGKAVKFDAYNIGGSNYFKLRDLAMALDGTSKKFAVSFDSETSTVGVTTGGTYAPVGGELEAGDGASRQTQPSTHKVKINGASVSISAYNIGGNNYFKLRDFMKLIDVFVGYNEATNTVTIDTSRGYEG